MSKDFIETLFGNWWVKAAVVAFTAGVIYNTIQNDISRQRGELERLRLALLDDEKRWDDTRLSVSSLTPLINGINDRTKRIETILDREYQRVSPSK